jgi:hypothetical protein
MLDKSKEGWGSGSGSSLELSSREGVKEWDQCYGRYRLDRALARHFYNPDLRLERDLQQFSILTTTTTTTTP